MSNVEQTISIQIIYFVLIFACSTLSSFAVVLSTFARDKDKGKPKYFLVYISEAIVSAMCGFLLGLIAIMMVEDNIILWIAVSLAGGFVGKGIIPVILKILFASAKINISEKDIKKLTDDRESRE